MKKIISLALVALMLVASLGMLASCGGKEQIIVNTNAYFAPFEYYEGTEIVGVDVDIMKKVGDCI